MKFIQHYSGSSGNLYEIVANNGKRLLIDPGVTWPKLQKALNYKLRGIVGCLVSQNHKDHCKAVKDVMKAGIDVYASEGTFTALRLDCERRASIVDDMNIIKIGKDFKCQAFRTNHDAVESLGFVVKCDDEYLLFTSESSHINQQFSYPFSLIAIECSFDKDILQHRVDTKNIPETLATRLLTSHMEKRETLRYLTDFCDLTKCREIHLLHLSGDNIDKKQTRIEFEKKLLIETRIIGD